MEHQPGTQDSLNPTSSSISFEQKLYRTLRDIDANLIPEYMESFGLDESRLSVGLKYKEFADRMTESEFVMAMREGKIPQVEFSPVEIEALYQGANDPMDPDDNCGA